MKAVKCNFFIRFRYTFTLILFFFLTHCEVDLQKSKYMSGKEANERITPRILAKLQSCGILKYTYNPGDSNPDPWRRTLSTETNSIFFSNHRANYKI